MRVGGETESTEKDFSLRVSKEKNSERKYRKGFSLLRSGEKENTEKDFPYYLARKKSERICRKRFSLLRSGEKESAEKDSLC